MSETRERCGGLHLSTVPHLKAKHFDVKNFHVIHNQFSAVKLKGLINDGRACRKSERDARHYSFFFCSHYRMQYSTRYSYFSSIKKIFKQNSTKRHNTLKLPYTFFSSVSFVCSRFAILNMK